MVTLMVQTDAGTAAAFSSLNGAPSGIAQSFDGVASPVAQQYETWTSALRGSTTDVAGLGDRAKMQASGTSPSVFVLAGHTLLKLDFTDGPVGGEKWLVPLAQQAVNALPARATTTTGG